MSDGVKKTIAIVVVAVIVFIAYYGSYLPYQKSKAHISAVTSLKGSFSVGEFKDTFSKALDLSSPIGQPELVRQLGSMSNSLVSQVGDNSAVIKELVDFVESYYEPILGRNPGMSIGQDFYILGSLNEQAFLYTGEVQYLNAAEKYFLLGQEFGPKRPQPLYGLFDVYRAMGNVEKVTEVANQILSQWPDDERVKALYESFLNVKESSD